MALQAKKLSYRVIEVSPGLGQLKVFRLSGQKQVPIIVDNGNVISNSSEIVKYLDKKSPEPRLVPIGKREAAEAHLIEQWADTTLATAARDRTKQCATTMNNWKMKCCISEQIFK